MIYDTIQSQIKDAMRAKDQLRLDTLRGMLAGFTNELVAKGRKPQEQLTDEEAVTVITKLAKQRKDAIEQYKAGARDELVKEESAQLAVLEEFLPTQMSREEIESYVKEKLASSGAIDPAKKGQFMGSIMKDLKGKADGGLVKEAIDKALG
jgi:uncharacterized protein YqeY